MQNKKKLSECLIKQITIEFNTIRNMSVNKENDWNLVICVKQ